MADNTKYLDYAGLQYYNDKLKSWINDQLATKVDKEDGKGLSTNDFTDELKGKLESLSDNATKVEVTADYTEGLKIVTIAVDEENKEVYVPDATLTTSGLLSPEDKSKLDSIKLDDIALKSDLVGAYKFKGSVATETDLPTEGNEVGDTYNTNDTGMNYAWTIGEDGNGMWDALGGSFTIDKITNEQIDDMFK